MNIYLFDMDGTLTPARQSMQPDFCFRFLPWLKAHYAYVAAGSNYEKVVEQLSPDVVRAFSGIYSSMGNVFHQKDKEIYRKDITLNKEMLQSLERYRRNTQYEGKLYGNYMELRPGMLNFSILGRNCPFSEREKYNQWDKEHKERETIATEMNKIFTQYEFSLGGKISIDIVEKGCGKEQIIHHVRETHPNDKIIFLGDRTEKGGNDYGLAEEMRKMDNCEVIAVNSPDDVLKYLGL